MSAIDNKQLKAAQAEAATATDTYTHVFKKPFTYVEPATGACIEYTAYTEDYDEDAKTNQQLELYAKVGSVAEAKTMAEKHLRLHNKFSKTVQFTHTGHVWYVAGVGIRVKGYGFWDGRYICTQAKHTINENGFTTTVTGRRILEGY